MLWGGRRGYGTIVTGSPKRTNTCVDARLKAAAQGVADSCGEQDFQKKNKRISSYTFDRSKNYQIIILAISY
jgi:hypothetical protein